MRDKYARWAMRGPKKVSELRIHDSRVGQGRGVALAVRGVQERRGEHWGWRASATVRQVMGEVRTEYGCGEEEYREGPPYWNVGGQHKPCCADRLGRAYL